MRRARLRRAMRGLTRVGSRSVGGAAFWSGSSWAAKHERNATRTYPPISSPPLISVDRRKLVTQYVDNVAHRICAIGDGQFDPSRDGSTTISPKSR